MKIIIIGNGASGTSAAQTIRNLDPAAEITIITDESLPYYARPRLPELITEKITPQNLQIYASSWYEQKHITLKLNTPVFAINPQDKKIKTENETLIFDKLLLATGAAAFKPPIPGIDQDGVFTLRTLSDAQKIQKAIKNSQNMIIIGGGLLGLEMAHSLTDPSRKIKIIDIHSTLLGNILSPEKSAVLREQLESRGFKFYFDTQCQAIEKHETGFTVITQASSQITGDLIIVASGVRPRTQLAAAAGLKIEKGIVINTYLETSAPDIFAAGDCIAHKNTGHIKSAMEQGTIAAHNMLAPQSKPYEGTKIDVILKVTGIDLKQI